MPVQPASLSAGRRLGRYELARSVASGGMGEVWLAHFVGRFGFRRRVALKTILPELAHDPHEKKTLLDEALIMARIEHVNVAQVLDVSEDDGVLYLVVEWIEGSSLARLCVKAEEKGLLVDARLAVDVVAQACAGVHAAHEACDENGASLGIVHRDVTPSNVLIGSGGVAKVIDFGIAKSKSRHATATRAGLMKGKAGYFAPEQALGFPVDRRTDVWGLGATLYRALTGRVPFETAEELLSYAYGKRGPPQWEGEPDERTERVVMRALVVEPGARYQTAEEMGEALRGLADATREPRASARAVTTTKPPAAER